MAFPYRSWRLRYLLVESQQLFQQSGLDVRVTHLFIIRQVVTKDKCLSKETKNL